ncbi:IS3 family transposase [Sporolactobacillus shoreicorticis]|uniref:IS3 family transposase n=1 Tax=Sporolactobacillus shoreicorticis TaxID=1923877 RepID=A0ABW5RZR4_9BACL|nr:IS3 family transposase [Sporolactobacillus shoreicorticis]MCO7128266.1 IS3 family transposase [Sporolactobacillus shoreicorticis]
MKSGYQPTDRQTIYQAIQSVSQQMSTFTKRCYSITQLCSIMHLSRAVYYKWHNSIQTSRQKTNTQLISYIRSLEQKNHFIFGARRLALYINHELDVHVTIKRIQRLMRENHIHCIIRVAKRDRQKIAKEMISKNILKHDFTALRPNSKWVTDCTELHYGTHEKLRLSAIKDLFDHRIVSWAVSATETTELLIRTVKQALKTNPHTDSILVHIVREVRIHRVSITIT